MRKLIGCVNPMHDTGGDILRGFQNDQKGEVIGTWASKTVSRSFTCQ